MNGKRTNRRGQMLLVAMVLATLVSVMLAMTMQPVTTAKQRMKERQLVYRANHIAEGIKRFYRAKGRFPFELEELEDHDPRFIRKLYPDPMTGETDWVLVYLRPTDLNAVKGLNRATRNLLGQTDEEGGELNSENTAERTPGGDKIRSLFRINTRQITGIRSASDETGLLLRDDSQIYSDWLFSALPQKDVSLQDVIKGLNNEVNPNELRP